MSLHFPCGSEGKEFTCNAGDLGFTPGSGTSLEEGTGYPLQYSCLENSHGQRSLGLRSMVSQKSQTRLSDSAHTHSVCLRCIACCFDTFV